MTSLCVSTDGVYTTQCVISLAFTVRSVGRFRAVLDVDAPPIRVDSDPLDAWHWSVRLMRNCEGAAKSLLQVKERQ